MSNALRQIHWLVPATAVGWLTAGILFAIGHHIFYDRLKGTTPSLAMYNIAGSHVSGQALNLAVGTAFAFLVRSCLALAMSLSYTQLAWYTIKQSTRDRTIPDIDKVTSALSNLLVIMNVFAWIKWPLLLLPALLSWLLPIATVITPATLTVGQKSPLPEMRDVPNVAYTSANMFTVSTISSGDTFYQGNNGQWYTESYEYQGPSDAVNLIAITVGAQGGVLPITPPAQNSTWSVNFFGPSMHCHNVSGPMHDAITLDIARYMNDSMFVNNLRDESSSTGLTNSALNPLYIAWTPPVPADFNPDNSSFGSYVHPIHRPTSGSKSYDPSDRGNGDLAPLFVAAIPSANKLLDPGHLGELLVATNWDRNTSLPQVVDKYIDPGLTLVQCDLLNATYNVQYTFSAGLQTIEKTIQPLDDRPLHVIDLAYGFMPTQNAPRLMPGQVGGETLPIPADCQGLWNASTGTNTTCHFDANVLNKFSYQAVWDAFTSLVRGGLYVDVGLYEPSAQKDTSVTNTVLARSAELEPIVELIRRRGEESLQQDLLHRYSRTPGMYVSPNETRTQPLSKMLEDLFHNMTLSLASSPELQANSSSPYKLPPSEVTFTMISPVYEYSRPRLWLAYGLAIAISAFIVIAGLTVMYLGSAAYNNNFSNILRLARGAHLSHEIFEEDHDGKEPLPKYLEKATVSFSGTAPWRHHAASDTEYKHIPAQVSEHSIAQNHHNPDPSSGRLSPRRAWAELHDAETTPRERSPIISQAASFDGESHSPRVSIGEPLSSDDGARKMEPGTVRLA